LHDETGLSGLSLGVKDMIFNPAHPGEVLQDYLGEMTVAEASRRLGVTRAHLFADSERKGGHPRFHVFASFGSVAH
jgi:hypothetical protein